MFGYARPGLLAQPPRRVCRIISSTWPSPALPQTIPTHVTGQLQPQSQPSWCPAGAHTASAVPLAAALQSQVGTRGILDISLSPGLALARVTGPCQPLERGPSVRCPP